MTAAGQDTVNTGRRISHAVRDGPYILAAAEPLLVLVAVQAPSEVNRAAAQAGGASRARRALLLVNQHARRGGEAIGAVLAAGGVAVEEHDYPKKDPIPDAIRAGAGAFDGVIVGGGDGTLHAASPALVGSGRPLGILPLGTGNDLACSLGIDPDPVMAAGVIAEGQVREIDLGKVNGHPFWNVASLGLSVELAQELTAATKRRWGRLGYARTALRVLRRLCRFTAELAHEGRTARVRTVQVAVGNGRHYGGGIDGGGDGGLTTACCTATASSPSSTVSRRLFRCDH